MDSLNQCFTQIFSFLLLPFEKLPLFWGLFAISFFSGILLIKLFGLVSSQAKIRQIKRKIQANMLSIVLFQDNLKLALRGVGKTLGSNLLYMRHALIPLVILMLPCILILAQLFARYDHRGLELNTSAPLQVVLDEGFSMEALKLQVPESLKLQGAPFKLRAKREVTWHVKGTQKGIYDAKIFYNDHVYNKKIVVGDYKGPSGVGRYKDWFNALLDPAENMLSQDSPINEITIKYLAQEYHFFGIAFHWMLIFLVVSIVGGLLFKDLLGVEI